MSTFNFTSHLCLTPIYRVRPNGVIELAVMSYTINYGKPDVWMSYRHPAETSEPGETVEVTAKDGINSEAAHNPNTGFKEIHLVSKPIYWAIGPDERIEKGLHLKLVIPASVVGEIRNDREHWDGREHHGKMEWTDIEKVIKRRMVNGQKIEFHLNATYETALSLAKSHVHAGEIQVRYAHILAEAEERRDGRRKPSEAEVRAVLEYCAKGKSA